MENNNITVIHDKVYQYLTEELKKDKLYFTLRVKNRADRLVQGYWFSGNEHYLAFSFWKGMDWRNKTPNIFFAINSAGISTLEFVCYDDATKINFFNNVAEAIGMQQKTKKGGEIFEYWVKNYNGSDYIDALSTFLKRDKKIIDAFIVSNDMKTVFEPIEEVEFKKAKKKIDAQRKKIQKDISYQKEYEDVKSIHLEELKVENISLFKMTSSILFNTHLTCLIGLNGTGKTSLLRALVLAFTGYEQNETMGIDDNTLLTSQLRNLLHIEGVNKDEKAMYANKGGFSEVTYRIESNTATTASSHYKNKVWITPENDDPKVSDDSESDFKNITDTRYKSLFLAFPQLQGSIPDVAKSNKKYPHVSDAISMLNNQPDNRFGEFSDWLIGLNNVANAKQAQGEAFPQEKMLLKQIFEVISDVTNEHVELHKIVVTEQQKHPIWIKVGKNSTPILFELISQGYNNVFGWVGYFMKRLIEVTPEDANFLETPAIVLIDEIDTYLHPLWQTRILEVLVRKFPKVQWVVTTHSPYVVGSIPKDKITIYTCKKEKNAISVELFDKFTPYGANIEQLSEKVFGVKGRFVSIIEERFRELSNLIKDGKLIEAKQYITNNFSEIDENDSELTRSKMLIRTKEILAK